MTPEEREKLNRLCQRAIDEQDPAKFLELIREMNDLLETKERRLEKQKSN